VIRGNHAGSASLVLFLLSIPPVGCASALKELPPLADLGGGGTRPKPEEVDALLARAERLYDQRTEASVRAAAAAWLEAARGDPTRVEGLVGAVRAQIWLVDHETDAPVRKDSATLAVQAARWCERIAPESPACAYSLGAALGIQAREKQTTALDALPRIEEAFRRATAGDPTLDQGGPHRALALLYLRAPGWPTGPGDPDRGLEEARKAVEVSPDFPPNQLALAEALSATGELEASRRAYRRALDKARELAPAEPDATDWIREAEKALSRP